MRELGYRTVDMLVDAIDAIPSGPPLQRASPDEMRERVPGEPPAGPRDFDGLMAELREDVLPFASRCDHPAYFAFIPANGTFPGALGDFIASAMNVYAGSWMESAGPSRLELVVLDWFKEWIGYPSEAAGVLVGGGSAANMTALACAREAATGSMSDRVVAYVSDQAHSSVARAARALGFRPDQVRVLPTDGRYRMRPDALAGSIAADARAGRRPLLVSASAGSTNTGAIDPLPEIAEICREAGLWLHVDAAYGGFAALTERGGRWLAGIEQADSVTLDPHKWLYQPFECGCLLVRDGRLLRSAFEIAPDYLKDAVTDAGEVNFSDLGLQLTRSSRALKLWLSLSYFGIDAFRQAIDRSLDMARLAENIVRQAPELELLAPAQLGIVCFRRRFPEVEEEWRRARLNAALIGQLEQEGVGLVSSTRLRGRYAIRLCVLNHSTGAEDVQRVLDWFAGAPVPDVGDPSAELAVALDDRAPNVDAGWLGPGDFTPEQVAALPLFEALPADRLDHVAAWARERQVPAGETVVQHWDGARDFFVIVDGTADVLLDDELLRVLGPGDFFGELAALDWGAGFGYVRTASVVATSRLRLLALTPTQLELLMGEAPSVDQAIRDTAAERLKRT